LPGIPLSSDAEEAGEFETLEERIVKTEREQENETWLGIRLEAWQLNISEIISVELGSNKSEIYNRAFVEGVRMIRERIGWSRIKDLFDMRLTLLKLSTGFIEDRGSSWDLQKDIHNVELELEHSPQGGLEDPATVPVERSVVSEIEENFADRMGMKKSHLFRIAIGAGLSKSQFTSPEHEDYAEEMVSSVLETVSESEEMIERLFYRALCLVAPYKDEVKSEKMEMINDFIDYMETDKKEICEDLVEGMEVKG
jgi:hypothetical protein